jgi:hypothetical protein
MGSGQAITGIHFAPLLPFWGMAALGGLCLAAVLLGYWRRARGTSFRLIGFALLLAWLGNPLIVRETRQPLPDIAVLVTDQTGSMRIGDRQVLANAAAAKILAEAAHMPGLDLRTVTVPEQGNAGTQLFTALRRALADIPASRLAGVIAITDGQVHDAPAAMPDNVPLHVLLAGAGEETDRRLRVLEAPSYGIVGQPVVLKIQIDDLGVPHPAATTALTLRRDGDAPVTETVPIGRPYVIELPILRAGPTLLSLQAEPLPGAVSRLNDHAALTVNGVRDRLRVLLISGEPHQGERTWRRLLKADPAVDLVHFTILRPPDKDDLTPLNELALIPFPVRELFQVKIRDFDLIILDRFQNGALLPPPYLQNIVDYVRGGGSLLLSVGPEFTGITSLAGSPIGAILPARVNDYAAVIEGKFRPMLTNLGARHPVTAGLEGANDPAKPNSQPSWGPWYRSIAATETEGETLMTAQDGAPLLILNRVGEGRVALLLSDQIWLWARGHEGGGPQAELLRRIAHWTMHEPALEENALTAAIEAGQLRIDRRRFTPPGSGEHESVTVTDPDGKTTTLPLTRRGAGDSGATMPVSNQGGVFAVSDGTLTAFAAAPLTNPREYADLRATATVLAPLVKASGGSIHWLSPRGAPAPRLIEAGQDSSGTDWIGLPRRHDHLVTGIAALPLVPSWAALPLLLGLIVLAWRREGA